MTISAVVRSNSAARVRRTGVVAITRHRTSWASRYSGLQVANQTGTARRMRSPTGRSAGWVARSAVSSSAVGSCITRCSLDW